MEDATHRQAVLGDAIDIKDEVWRHILGPEKACAEFRYLHELRFKDPAAFEDSAADYQVRLKAIVEQVLDECVVLHGTSVAAAKLVNIFRWTPQIIFHDDATRFTSASQRVAWGAWQHACVRISVGDTKQCGPHNPLQMAERLSVTRSGNSAPEDYDDGDDDDGRYITPYSRQGNISIMHRQLATDGFKVHHLWTNWRCRGTLAAHASRDYYDRKMVLGHLNSTLPQAEKKLVTWLQNKAPGTSGERLFINVEGTAEASRSGTSYYNDDETNVALELILDLAGSDVRIGGRRPSITVISPYAAQVERVRVLVDELSPSEVCRELVDVRTVTSSMSEAADLVIHTWAATSNPFWLAHPAIQNVSTTRARYAEIIVGRKDMMRPPTQEGPGRCDSVWKLISDLTDRHAVIDREAEYRCSVCREMHGDERCGSRLSSDYCKAYRPSQDHQHALRECYFKDKHRRLLPEDKV